jgi:uncharacterized protein YwgA
MNAARIELKLVLDRAGIEINLDRFSQRFNVQKRVYLIQIVGVDLGYRYGWYLRGPYSSTLTADAFALRDEAADGEQDHFGCSLTPEQVEKIEKARSLWALPNDVAVSNDEWLELLASLHYLRHIAYWPKGTPKDFAAVFSKLVESKPHFARANAVARQAWERLAEFGLIAVKTLA